MKIEDITNNLTETIKNIDEKNFIFKFIESFNFPKSTISRLKKGDRNSSVIEGELIWRDKLYFINAKNKKDDLYLLINETKSKPEIKKLKVRFIIVTDFSQLLAIDTKTQKSLECKIKDLAKHSSYFLPLIGIDQYQGSEENPADLKAAREIGKLYDQLLIDNKSLDIAKYRQDLNIFFSRLLFLYYADDAEIFEKNLFLQSITEFTDKDGKNLDEFFNKLFEVLNSESRANIPQYFVKFPYVNGSIFKTKIKLPNFTRKTREMIVSSASLDWHIINPDILGSMLQAVVSPEERDDEEMHYTSVPNILNVIGPLFLDILENRIEEAENDEKNLKKILRYIYNIKIFDPACGSGNFLIITYKQLCRLEIRIFRLLLKLSPDEWKMSVSGISLNQFYGIEKSHYAAETAKLSLWLAEHQMNLEFKEVFGISKPSLPISELGNIVCENSITFDWIKFCSMDKKTEEIFIVGNPPFKGYRARTKEQKEDIEFYFNGKNSKVDYVALWFFKGTDFILKYNKVKLAFVATNSVNQGEQVNLIWPRIFDRDIEIIFANKSFRWKNSARNNAVVTVSIIGLALKDSKFKKHLIFNDKKTHIKNLNAYLLESKNIIVKNCNKSLSDLPKMSYGSMANDGGYLVLENNEKDKLIKEAAESKKFLKPFVGGIDFIRGTKRWCLWIEDKDLNEATSIKFIKDRFEKVKAHRKKKDNNNKWVERPHKFVEDRHKEEDAIFVPTTTSERREYLPIGFYEKGTLITAPNQVVYNPPMYLFSILSSRMHMLWLQTVGGKLKTHLRYSNELCYNTFPFPEISNEIKNTLKEVALRLLVDERERHFEKTISELYDPDTMPKGLRDLHQEIDTIVEKCYQSKTFLNDEEKLKCLFDMYADKSPESERLI